MAEHNQLGAKGEQIALSFLEKLNYKIIASNWKEKKYEIDIIAVDNNEIVFVEVKTRSSEEFGNPEEAVTLKKQQHLIEGADHYIQKNEIDLDCRFDVISIIQNKNDNKLNHIKSAFYPEV